MLTERTTTDYLLYVLSLEVFKLGLSETALIHFKTYYKLLLQPAVF